MQTQASTASLMSLNLVLKNLKQLIWTLLHLELSSIFAMKIWNCHDKRGTDRDTQHISFHSVTQDIFCRKESQIFGRRFHIAMFVYSYKWVVIRYDRISLYIWNTWTTYSENCHISYAFLEGFGTWNFWFLGIRFFS